MRSVEGSPTKQPPKVAPLNGHQEQLIANGLPQEEKSSSEENNKKSSSAEAGEKLPGAKTEEGSLCGDAESPCAKRDEKETGKDEEDGRGEREDGREDTAEEEKEGGVSNGIHAQEEETKVNSKLLLIRKLFCK